jgi:hypothetical protein
MNREDSLSEALDIAAPGEQHGDSKGFGGWSAVYIPPFAKCAKDGAPGGGWGARSDGWFWGLGPIYRLPFVQLA